MYNNYIVCKGSREANNCSLLFYCNVIVLDTLLISGITDTIELTEYNFTIQIELRRME